MTSDTKCSFLKGQPKIAYTRIWATATNEAQNLTLRQKGGAASPVGISEYLGDTQRMTTSAPQIETDDDEGAGIEMHQRTQQTRPRSSSSPFGLVTKLTITSVTDEAANDQNAVQR